MSSPTSTVPLLDIKSTLGMNFQPPRNLSETPSQSSSIKSSEVLVQNLSVLGKTVYETVATLSLSTHDDISDSNKALWLGASTNLPQILEGSGCWSSTPPTTSDIIISTLDLIEKKKSDSSITFTTYRKGGSDETVDPRLAIAQLCEPDMSNQAAIIGLNLEILPEGLLEAPIALSEFVEPFDQSEQSLLLTPKYWCTDLHIDSADGISAPMGSCVKIWVTFPPTKKNLAMMRNAEGQKAKVARIGKQLEGGLIFSTDGTQAVYLPVGTLHAVYTTHGGFLMGIDLTTPESSRTYANIMGAGLDGNGRFQEAVFDRFLLSIDLGLDNNRVALAIQAWVDAEEWTREWAAEHPDWARDAVGVWDEFLGKSQARKMSKCPCGRMKKGGSFVGHFRAAHVMKAPAALKRKRGGSSGGAKSNKRRKR